MEMVLGARGGSQEAPAWPIWSLLCELTLAMLTSRVVGDMGLWPPPQGVPHAPGPDGESSPQGLWTAGLGPASVLQGRLAGRCVAGGGASVPGSHSRVLQGLSCCVPVSVPVVVELQMGHEGGLPRAEVARSEEGSRRWPRRAPLGDQGLWLACRAQIPLTDWVVGRRSFWPPCP